MAESPTLIQHFQRVDIRWLAVATSFLFSLVVVAGNPVPNDDAFSYVRAAEVFSSRGLDATLSMFGWYGYSVLIALLNDILQTGFFTSAHLLNSFSFALVVYAFITLTSEFNDSDTCKIIAAVVILCFPTINELRFNLIRDFAYWGFVLTALVQLIRFNKTRQVIHAAGWLVTMLAAIFFRLEGLLLLVLSPLAILLPGVHAPGVRRRLFITLLLLMLAGVVLSVLVFLGAGINLIGVSGFAYRWYLPLLTDYPATLFGAASNTGLSVHISDQLLPFTGKGMLALFIGYLYAVIANLVMSLGPAASLFLAWCLATHRQPLPTACKWPWLLMLAGALLSLLIFVSIMQFLTTRYAVMASLLLLVLVVLYINDLYQAATASNKQDTFRAVFAGVVLYFVVDSLVSFGYRKTYIEEAIDWSRENLPAQALIQTNSFPVAYFSGLVEDYDRIDPDPATTLSDYIGKQFVILDVAADDQTTRTLLAQDEYLTELARFTNARGDAIIVYRIVNEERTEE